jgi:hypothetical protein
MYQARAHNELTQFVGEEPNFGRNAASKVVARNLHALE